MQARRSIREYSDLPLTIEHISQLLWAGQGITADWGGRTAPSAGATYPLELYIVVGSVEGLTPGVYVYDPQDHSIRRTLEGDVRKNLSEAAVGQRWVEEAPACIVITGVYERTTGKYGERGIKYVWVEAGCATQNIYLHCAALGLGTVSVGAFYDDQAVQILGLSDDHRPLIIMPVGVPS